MVLHDATPKRSNELHFGRALPALPSQRAQANAGIRIATYELKQAVDLQLVNRALVAIEADDYSIQMQCLTVDKCIDVAAETDGSAPVGVPFSACGTPKILHGVPQINGDERGGDWKPKYQIDGFYARHKI